MPRLTIYPGYSGVLLAVFALLAVVLIYVFYRQAWGALQRRQWLLLFALRIGSVAIILMLLFRPVLSFDAQKNQRQRLIVLLDNSASMSVADNAAGGPRWQQVRDTVLSWWPKLNELSTPELITFADSAARLTGPDKLADVRPIGDATSITRGLIAAKKSAANQQVRGVLLFSDGVQNAAGNPAGTARRLAMPVYAIGVGDPLHERSLRRDVRVTGLDCPPDMAVGNRIRITGYVDATGLPGRVVTVRLLEDDAEVAQQELTLDDVDGGQEVTLEFVPAVKGIHTYTVTVPKLPDEKIPQNNSRSTSALVHEARIRVLYLEGTLRPEYGAIVGRFLSKDPNIEFCALMQTRPNVFVQRSNMRDIQLTGIPNDPEILDRFDVFVLGDLDATFLAKGVMPLLVERVRAGAGLIMIGGYHSLGPGGYGNTPLEEILPVALGPRDIGQVTETFQPQLTPAGRRHPIFANIARFFDSVGGTSQAASLPPLDGCVRVARPRPGANILLVHPHEQVGDRPLPVMAVQPVGTGRTAVFTADTTRNWHQALKTMDQETPFLRFWGQVIRWLAKRDAAVGTESGIAATTDRSYYAPGEPIQLQVILRGKDGAAVSTAAVEATILGPGRRAQRLKIPPATGPSGHYSAVYEPPRSGRYTFTVTARFNDQTLTAENIEVGVGRPNLEFDQLDLDEKALLAIASESGGQYTHISVADRLLDQLQRAYQQERIEYEVSLAWPPALWILFVCCITTEWLLRRRYQLR